MFEQIKRGKFTVSSYMPRAFMHVVVAFLVNHSLVPFIMCFLKNVNFKMAQEKAQRIQSPTMTCINKCTDYDDCMYVCVI